jgi:hypothetical protein
MSVKWPCECVDPGRAVTGTPQLVQLRFKPPEGGGCCLQVKEYIRLMEQHKRHYRYTEQRMSQHNTVSPRQHQRAGLSTARTSIRAVNTRVQQHTTDACIGSEQAHVHLLNMPHKNREGQKERGCNPKRERGHLSHLACGRSARCMLCYAMLHVSQVACHTQAQMPICHNKPANMLKKPAMLQTAQLLHTPSTTHASP